MQKSAFLYTNGKRAEKEIKRAVSFTIAITIKTNHHLRGINLTRDVKPETVTKH